MPVLAFVGQNASGQPWPPDHHHEARAAIELVRRLTGALHHEPATYALLANLHHPNADMVVLTQRGIGVVELKHYFGRIQEGAGGTWYAGPKRIEAGRYANPHQQVQTYATQVRAAMEPLLSSFWRLPSEQRWRAYATQIVVCFTNPQAVLDDRTRDLLRRAQHARLPWETLSLLQPDDFASWVASLRFGVDQGYTRQFAPYELQADQVREIVTRGLRGVPWNELAQLIPAGQPYGYLRVLVNGQEAQAIPLTEDAYVLGRDEKVCKHCIPRQYKRVSNEHARISRELNDVYIEDLGSTNGTFVAGRFISDRERLEPEQRITLGGDTPTEEVYTLIFSATSKPSPDTYRSATT